ncbi:phosphoribosyltransferase [Actinoplanes sp. NPDC051859]|uniref:phosphoribosyltransferase n=1 Tax=Actinoplanes sp. NPDC051859 TaxID=3363909 RepID=UPI0037AD43F1
MTATGAQRVFRHQLVWQLTDDVFQHAARLLVREAQHRHGPLSAVVGIAHGGLPLADLAADIIGVPHHAVAARHNPTDHAYEQATGHVHVDTSALAAALDGARLPGPVLLVDDICGSAATLDTVIPALQPFLEPHAQVITAVLCRNIGAARNPHLWVWDVSDWVIFPWETPPTTPASALPAPARIRTA